MSIILGIFVGLLLLVSLFFNCLGVVCIYRFPDVYTRLHGAVKCTALGAVFCVFALLSYSFARFMADGENRFIVFFIHVIIAAAVLLLSKPTGGHAVARAAHRFGILPEPSIADDLEEMKKMKKRIGGKTE